MTSSRRFGRSQRGQAIVLIAIMLAVLIGMVALAIDGSRGYAMRRDMQAAIDAASLAAGDSLQRGSSYASAEQTATNIFASNLRLYSSPSCTPYGTPGASPLTVTCTFSDGTVLTQTVSDLGAQGTTFSLRATRQVPLQFGRVLTNGGIPTLSAVGAGSIDNLVYTPAVAALNQAGCGGTGGAALTVSGTGTLGVLGDVVTNGAVSIATGSMRVAGDLYARCQSSVSGATTVCYPSGGSTPCTYPDVAGVTRSGFRLVDPRYPAPAQLGSSQGSPASNAVLPSGIYASITPFFFHRCWFLSGGVYTWQSGYLNLTDLVSNELKPPDEPNPADNTQLSAKQFWNANGVNCAGSVQVQRTTGGGGAVPSGIWAFEVTATRTDSYNGVTYMRESAPSRCQTVSLTAPFDDVQLAISNVPGATAYNVYAAPPNGGCSGPFGLATTVPVSGAVLNSSTGACPAFSGVTCSLGNETVDLLGAIKPPFAPNGAASPGTAGAYPPDSELPPVAAGLPNQNPGRGSGATGDRANENRCATAAGAAAACPAAVTPGAVEFNVPVGGCVDAVNIGDTYLFSGYQYDWISVFEPPANTCLNLIGGATNSAYIGLFYAPGATVDVTSQFTFASVGTAGVMANYVGFAGGLPSITYSAAYAPAPPASRLAS